MSRFLLNLRQIDQYADCSTTVRFAASTAIGSFAMSSSVVGTFGQPLDYGFEDYSNEAENETTALV